MVTKQKERNPVPDVLYMGLQRSGSTFLRAFFTKHPEIVWTRQAYRLQTHSLMQEYRTHALEDRQKQMAASSASSEARVWIDMFESVGLQYSLCSERWASETMISFEERNNELRGYDPELFPRIKTLMPNTKVLLTIRSQPDWLISNYHHFWDYLPKNRNSFLDFIDTNEGKILKRAAFYPQTLQRLAEVFGEKRFKIVLTEQLEKDPSKTLDEIASFLGCGHIEFDPSREDYNRGKDHLGYTQSENQNTGADDSGQPRSGHESPNASPPKSKSYLKRKHETFFQNTYAESNHQLQQMLNTDLSGYGYPLA